MFYILVSQKLFTLMVQPNINTNNVIDCLNNTFYQYDYDTAFQAATRYLNYLIFK